jgi:hypothetical protein
MSQNEDELLDLMAVAKKQLATVQTATDAMQTERRELYDAIAQLKNMRVTVAEDAKKGVELGISGIGTDANTALRAEVNKAKTTLGEMIDELRGTAWALSWRWILGLLFTGLLLGLVFSWMIWGRGISNRLDAIEQTLQQRQAAPSIDAAPAAAVKKSATQKQTTHAQKIRGQGSEPAAPQEQP